MGNLEAVAPPEDRVRVYTENPRYIQYRGEPIFLFGCNQGWTASLQNLDHDYRHEFGRLHEVGGNLVRLTPFLPPTVDDPDRFDDRKNNYPWRREGEQYHLDLDRDGGNPAFWNRLADLVTYAYERDLVLSFEFWDLYGPARGPGGNLNFRTPPGDRWGAHPFFPGNSPDLTGEDMLPAQTHMKDIAYCHTVTQGGYNKALRFQEQYVRRMLDVLSPYPNVIYCMVNETSAEKVWSDYWLKFAHAYFDEVWDGAPHLAGEMPREFSFTENFTVEQMVDDPSYFFADTSQYFTGGGLTEIQKVKRNLSAFYDYTEKTGKIKPLTCMKIYNRDASAVLWMRLLGGSASARYHRAIAGNYTPPEGVDPVERQLTYVKRLADFLRETGFEPWQMQPDHAVVVEAEDVDETLAMCSADRRVCAVLVYCEGEHIAEERFITLALPQGQYRFFWCSPSAETHTEAVRVSVGETDDAGFEVPNDPDFASAVLYVAPCEEED